MKKQKKTEEDTFTKRWVTDGAWITGILGAITVVFLAYYYHVHNVFTKGVFILDTKISTTKTDSLLFALLIIVVVMFIAETIRVWRFKGKHYISIDPRIKKKEYSNFVTSCVVIYLETLLLLWLCIQFYHTAGEYGFAKHAHYYQPWFRLLSFIWDIYLWCGLPYILTTRAFKHDTKSDQKDLAQLVDLSGRKFFDFVTLAPEKKRFDDAALKAARGLLVKVFFTPIMTVFFFDQFTNLVNNFDYIFDGFINSISNGTYNHRTFNKDLVNISMSLIFSIDVAIAWCGYVVSSRWVDNQTISAEPTLMGWCVCLLSYPPFRVMMGWILTGPGDQMFLSIPNQSVVTIFAVMMALSYFVYMSATLCFGIRFSNLTHRGIIRTGAFAWVRHPAYAAKNFGWWCVGFPVVVYNIENTGLKYAFLLFLGLCLNTWIYYLRAITEERHLSIDDDYVTYCKHVRYRFIPGIL